MPESYTHSNNSSQEAIPSFKQRKLLRTTAGLDPYAGNWNELNAEHLLRRTMFGPKRSEILAASFGTLDNVLTLLLADQPAPSIPPDPIVPGRDWTIGPFSDISDEHYQYENALRRWWMKLMLTQGISIIEKMTLFLHNFFASEYDIINDARYLYTQNALFRQYALGNIKELVKAVTLDPAMLIYLNGYLNRIPTPDENYARELQELFTIGKGPQRGEGDYTNYTEQDVKAAARVLTGWTVRQSTIPPAATFVQRNHDKESKQFSSAYQNAVINVSLKTDGTIDGYKEMSDLVDMIFNHPETAKNFCRKLYRWFVYYDIDDTVEQNVISPLADVMVQNNFEIKPVLNALFRSSHFFDTNNVGCVIKNPIDFIVSSVRQLDFQFSDPSSADYVAMVDRFNSTSEDLQMEIFNPPNVAGWPAYHQIPDFHEIWINTTTFPLRGRFTDSLINGIRPQGSNISYKIDPVIYAATLSNPSNPFTLIDEIAANLLPPIQSGVPLTADQKDYLMYNVMGLVHNDEYEWTAQWNLAQQNPPDTNALQTVTNSLKSLLKFIMRMPEYQLS